MRCYTLGGLTGYQAHCRPLVVVPAVAGALGVSPPVASMQRTLSLAWHLFPTDGAHACQQWGQLHLGAFPAGPCTSAKWPAQSQPPRQSAVSGAAGAGAGRVPWAGLKGLVPKLLPPVASCVLHAAPSSQSSSGQNTRCWRLCTSFPAVMMMGSPPKTSARCEGPLFPHPRHPEA